MRLSLAARIFFGFFILILLLVLSSLFGIYALGRMNTNLNHIVDYSSSRIQRSERVRSLVLDIIRFQKNLLLSDSASEQKEILKQLDSLQEQANTGLKELERLLESEEGRDLYREVSEAWTSFLDAADNIEALIKEGKHAGALTVSNTTAKEAEKSISDAVSSFIEQNNKELASEKKASDQNYGTTRLVILLAAIVSISIGILVAWLITSKVKNQVGGEPDAIEAIAHRVAAGDLRNQVLTQEATRKKISGIYASLMEMSTALTEIVREVSGAAENVSAGSEELSQTAQELSQGSSEQAASTEELASSVEQISAMVRQNSENAQQTNTIAQKAAQDAKVGGEAMDESVAAMEKIAEKSSVIDELARSTNMLALNAAIEAARVGEEGRGFAVVAAEVRKLAQRSQDAANDIAATTETGFNAAKKAGELIRKLVPDILKTAELVQEIAAASEEQNDGIDQVNQAIEQLNQVVQQNASASEESASSAEELAAQAERLQEAIGFFKISEGKKTTAIRPVAALESPKDNKHTEEVRQNYRSHQEDDLDSDFEAF
jgi:methyl-accepting chemotaxis protein